MHQTTAVPRRLWQIAGGLALAHVVLIMAGIALQSGPLFQDGAAGIQRGYVEGDLARTFTGGLIECVGFLLLIPVLVFLSRVLGRSSETGRHSHRSPVYQISPSSTSVRSTWTTKSGFPSVCR